jgi:hypothetical protein
VRIIVEPPGEYPSASRIAGNVGNLQMEDAFAVLRRYARDHGHKLTVVAEQVVNRDLRGQDLIEYARSASVLP